MPEYDPWGLSGPIRNIGGILAQTPRLRAEAEASRQRGRLTEAQIGTEGAQAEHYLAQGRKTDTETAGLKGRQAGDDRRADGLRRLAQNPNDSEALADVLEESGRAMREDPEREIQGISRLLGMFRSLGNTNLQSADPIGLSTAAGNAVPLTSGADKSTWEAAQTARADLADAGNRSRETIGRERNQTSLDVADKNNVARTGIAALNNVMRPVPPKSSAVEQERTRLIAALAKLDAQNQTTNAPGAIQQFDQMAGTTPGQAPAAAGKPLDAATAKALLAEAGGDKTLARKMAAERGYTF